MKCSVGCKAWSPWGVVSIRVLFPHLSLLWDMLLEVLPMLEEPEEEDGDDGVLQHHGLRHVLHVCDQVHQGLVIPLGVGLCHGEHWFLQVQVHLGGSSRLAPLVSLTSNMAWWSRKKSRFLCVMALERMTC